MPYSNLRSQLDKGEAMFERGDIYGAVMQIQNVLGSANNNDYPDIHFEAVVTMANIYWAANENAKAEELIRNLPYCENCKKGSFAQQYYYRLKEFLAGTIHKDYATSIEMADSAIAVASRLYPEHPNVMLIDIANKSETLMKWGHYDEAWKIVNEIENLPIRVDSVVFSEIYLVHASLLYNENKYDSAYVYAEKGAIASHGHGVSDNELQCLSIMCKVDSLREDFKSYIQKHRVYDEIKAENSFQEVESLSASTKALIQAEFYKKKLHDNQIISILAILLLQ